MDSWFGDLFGGGDAGALAGDVPYYLADPNVVPNVTFEDTSSWNPDGGMSNYVFDTPSDFADYTAPFNMMNEIQGVDGQAPPQIASPIPQNTAVSPSNTPQSAGSFMDVIQNTGKQAVKGLGSMMDVAQKNPKTALGLGGLAANLAGNYMNNQAQKGAQSNYLSAVSWTPEKVNNYMNALRSNVTSLYGNQAQGANKAMAASNASRGRGGGNYGNQQQAINREMRNSMAQALNQGALTTNQPNTNLPMSAFATSSPVGDTLTGLGGIMGSNLKSIQDQEAMTKLLQQLGLR